MPTASIQLCKFHVTQAFQREIRKCAVDENRRKKLMVSKIVFVKSQRMFHQGKADFITLAPLRLANYLDGKQLDTIH